MPRNILQRILKLKVLTGQILFDRSLLGNLTLILFMKADRSEIPGEPRYLRGRWLVKRAIDGRGWHTK